MKYDLRVRSACTSRVSMGGGLQGVSSDYAAIPNFSEAMMGGGEAGGPSGPRSEQ